MLIEFVIHPIPKQLEFFRSKAKYTAYGGARGGGKSWAMRVKFILLAARYPGINILLLRRTLGELRENHIIPLRALLNGVAVYRKFYVTGKQVLVGRDARNDLCMEFGSFIAGRHFLIDYSGRKAYLKTDSKNTVYKNNKIIRGTGELAFGDVISIFGLSLIYFGHIIVLLLLASQHKQFKCCLVSIEI